MIQRSVRIALIVAAVSAASAQAQAPDTIRLTVHPAAAPVPALKYRLLPDVTDLLPGNAAIFYLRAYSPEWLTHRRMPGIENKLVAWRSAPLKELPLKEMAWLNTYHPLRELDYAARHDRCNWELQDRARKEGIQFRLPDLQGYRELTNLLAVRVRLEIAEHRYPEAISSLQTGFSLAVDVAQGPTLIHLLVGIAVATVMAEQVETLIEQPDAPNLYWALTDLPSPLAHFRKPLFAEKVLVESLLPRLHDLETTIMTPQQLEEQLEYPRRMLGESNWSAFGPADGTGRALLALLVAKTYPAAKVALIKQGRPPDQVEAMPALQVVLLYSLEEYRRFRDSTFRWAELPYWQAARGLRRADDELRAARASGSEGLPFASTLLPATQKVFAARARADRRIAALRCIEVVRLYAAAHDGKLPLELSDVADAPIPLDPMTGNAFGYHVEGNKFTLLGPAPPGEGPHAMNTLQYEVTLTRAGQ